MANASGAVVAVTAPRPGRGAGHAAAPTRSSARCGRPARAASSATARPRCSTTTPVGQRPQLGSARPTPAAPRRPRRAPPASRRGSPRSRRCRRRGSAARTPAASAVGRASSRATTSFCWLPPDSPRASAVGSGGRMSDSAMQRSGPRRHGARGRDPGRPVKLALPAQHQVVGRREKSSTSPRAWRSSGTWPRPALAARAHARPRDIAARRARTLPARRRRRPARASQQLALAVALDPGDADDLAGPDLPATRQPTAVAATALARDLERAQPPAPPSPGVAAALVDR